MILASDQIDELALKYMELLGIPKKTEIDCYHLTASVNYKTDYLLSWNFKYFNSNTYSKILKYNDKHHGLVTPFLIIPE
jgi:hypothetical protein